MSVFGIDVDGVLADFNAAYVKACIDVTGVDRFEDAKDDPATFPPCWSYPEHFGYSSAEVSKVWKAIKKDDGFWAMLKPLPGAGDVVRKLDEMRLEGHDIYFITARPGIRSKWQTEVWLMDLGMLVPTVVMDADKAGQVMSLGIDAYIDDRLDNANAVMAAIRHAGRMTRVYLKDAPYNRRPEAKFEDGQTWVVKDERDPSLIAVEDVREMLGREGV